MDVREVKKLLERYRTGTCSDAEMEIIESWYKRLIDTEEFEWNEGERDATQEMIEARILSRIEAIKKEKSSSHFMKSAGWWAAAASVILLAGILTYSSFWNKRERQESIAAVTDVKAPQSNRAMITLANGRKIFLDSAGNGSLAVQGSLNIIKLKGGSIAYVGNNQKTSGHIEYNTLSNPRGSNIINITLADGSKVWLNAASSLTYPVAFDEKERKVSVSGEAYFEVEHDASRPFIVNKGSMNIHVLGTHFNVNAFEDDGNNIKVTLLEGSVRISSGNTSGLLKPGEQAVVGNELKIKNDVDLDKVMGWKNGFFEFDNATLQEVLKEISRWYDVDVVYEGSLPERKFVGELQRDLNLSEMLKILEKNKVHFTLEDKKLTVLPH